MNLHFDVQEKASVVESIAAQLQLPLEGNTLQLPEVLGDGFLQSISLPGGWGFNHYCFSLNLSVTFVTSNPADSGRHNLIINPASARLEKYIDGKKISVGNELSGGLFYQAPGTPASMHFQSGEHYHFISILFEKPSVQPYIEAEAEGELSEFLGISPLYLFEEFDLPAESLALALLTDQPSNNIFQIHSHLLQLMQFFFRQALKPNRVSAGQRVSESDLQALMIARARLNESLDEKPPTIPELAKLIGLSESKLKRTFKQLFGKSIFQYARYVRMMQAQRMFDSRRYNITQVAQEVGYSNLSHFGQAFEQQFGLKPRAYLQQQ